MSERKVLNKYYPPDFDPLKIPKGRSARTRQFIIRLMAPMSIKCDNCGEYIYKGKKFNSRQETIMNETYLGLRLYRFYIKCPRCMSEITFRTDPKNADYRIEQGGKRCFDAAKLAAKIKEREQERAIEEEKINPMEALEKRTKDSRIEMETIEKLEEIRELNKRHLDVDLDQLIEDHITSYTFEKVESEHKKQVQLDEEYAKNAFKNKVVTKDIENHDFTNTFSNMKKNASEDKFKAPSKSKSSFLIFKNKQKDANLTDNINNTLKNDTNSDNNNSTFDKSGNVSSKYNNSKLTNICGEQNFDMNVVNKTKDCSAASTESKLVAYSSSDGSDE